MKNLLYPIVFALTAFLFVYSCSTDEEDTTPPPQIQQPTPEPEPEVTQFTLTVTAGEGGTVSTEGGTYDEGTEVTITATPTEGYEFVGWEGSDSTETSLTITLGQNSTIKALFELKRKYDFSQSSRNYNLPHHITRNSTYSWINVHEIMIRNGIDWVGPDQSGPAFADWSGDGYEDIIVSPLSMDCWTCEGEKPQLYIYDTDLGDFIYEEMVFKSNENEILNRIGTKIIGDFDNDGDPDLLFGGYKDADYDTYDKVWILENNYSIDGTFIPHDLSDLIKINETATVDIDSDGDLDIFVVQHLKENYYSRKPVFLINNGNFEFSLSEEYFEYIEEVDLQGLFYNNGENNSTIFEDINQDGFIDVLWNQPRDWWVEDDKQHHRELLKSINKVVWGNSSGVYSIDDFTPIPNIEGFQLVDGIEPWDYNNDGVKELVVIRDNATSWDDAHSTTQGFYVQILQVDDRDLIDITESTIENFTEVNNTNLKPIRFIDFDGDGYLSMIRLVTNVEFNQSFEWEWDGSKIIKVSP